MPPAPADSARRLADATSAWLAMLDAGQRSAATFAFRDDERVVWAYTPVTWQGLAIADMTVAQRLAAFAVVSAALSARAALEVEAIIGLEPILGDLERAEGDEMWRRRDPERYWFAVFGEPAVGEDAAPWSWRLGGHHLSVQVTVADGRVVGHAPSFLGANPAVVPSGPHAGLRALTGEETLARAVLDGLDGATRAVAVVDPVAPPDIRSGTGRRAVLDDIPAGVARSALDAGGRGRLDALVRHYLERSTAEVAAARWAAVEDAGLDEITFAWAGSSAVGQGHYYAVRGPSFLIEYDNTQDEANHIHSVWRDVAGDWGDDVLAGHYRAAHA